MTLKDLKRYRSAKMRVQSLTERITQLRSLAERVTGAADLAGVNGAPKRDGMADTVAKIVETQERLRVSVGEAAALMARIEDWVRTLDGEEQTVITLRYLDGLSWRAIARRMHYDERTPYKIQKRALSREEGI